MPYGAPLFLTPAGQEEWRRRQALTGRGSPAVAAPPKPKNKQPGFNAADIFAALPLPIQMQLGVLAAANPLTAGMTSAPQGQNEPNVSYTVRQAAGSPFRKLTDTSNDVAQFFGEAVDTPAKRQARERAAQPQSPAGGFPKSYNDPAYAAIEAQVAQQLGGPYAPTLANLLGRIRTQGEKTNAGVQNATTGANTPYQITSKTRAGIQKNYGFDPWSSPENAARGAAYVVLEQAGAFSKKGGVNLNDPAVQARAVGGYFGGAKGAANPFSSISDGISTAGEYTSRVLGPNTGLSAPYLNPYDPRYDAAALGEVEKGRQALMTPFSTSMNIGPPPAMPKPEALPETDFSKTDAALQAMRPVEMSEKERLRRERTGFWSGLAQGMMHTTGNEGLGTFLLKLGGAALGGRMSARDDIEKEQDRFEDKLAQFNAAVFQNEWAKAKIHQGELKEQVDQNNQFNQANWKVAYSRWLGNGTVDISGTNVVKTTRDDKGNVTVSTVPIGPAVNAAVAQQRAGLFQSMGGRQFAGNQQITGIENGILGRAAIQSMVNSGADSGEADGAAAAAPAFYGTFIASHGLTTDLLGPDGAKSLEQSVQKQLMGMGMAPGSQQFIERRDTLIATELAKLGLASPDMMQRMMQVGASANTFEALDAVNSRKTRTSVNAKGQTTTSSTQNAADVFDSNRFNDQLAEAGYERR